MAIELENLVRIDNEILAAESRRHVCLDPLSLSRIKSHIRKPLRSRWIIVGWVSLYSALLLLFTFLHLSLVNRLETRQKTAAGADARPLLARTFHEVIPWLKN